jgi:hypothetical protein
MHGFYFETIVARQIKWLATACESALTVEAYALRAGDFDLAARMADTAADMSRDAFALACQ